MTKSNYHKEPKRDSCYFCPARRDLEEHHVIPQRFGGSDGPENVVTVCSKCHKRLERLYDKSFYEWFGIDDEEGERHFHRPCVVCERQATRLMKSSFDGGLIHTCEKHAHRVPQDSQTIEDATEKKADGVPERDKHTVRRIKLYENADELESE